MFDSIKVKRKTFASLSSTISGYGTGSPKSSQCVEYRFRLSLNFTNQLLVSFFDKLVKNVIQNNSDALMRCT